MSNGKKPLNPNVEMGRDVVGWTDDGQVFMIVWSKMDRGTIREIENSTYQGESIPLRFIKQWSPKQAREVIEAIDKACKEIENKGVAHG